MKKSHHKFPGDGVFFVIGLLVLCILGVGIYFVARFLVNIITSMDEEIARIFNSALVFVLFTAIIVSFIVWRIQRATHERGLRMERAEVYARFLKTLLNTLYNARPADAQKTRQLKEDLHAAETHFLLCAKSNVLEPYMEFRQEVADAGLDNPRVERFVGEIVAAMRNDLLGDKLPVDEGGIASFLFVSSDNIQSAVQRNDSGSGITTTGESTTPTIPQLMDRESGLESKSAEDMNHTR